MFDKILIANRGEIARRIMKSAKALGIKCVAIYSDADQNAFYLDEADEAHHVGPAAASESYLCYDKILKIAVATGAQAIHPGYGFLAENAEFAKQCEQHNIVFIGPAAKTILDMGSKAKAKSIIEKAKIPVIPGYHGELQDHDTLLQCAFDIGFPVLLKAAAGGGGKGMRIIREQSEFTSALAGAKREALSSFGDDRIIIEKFLEHPRHIEIQVFADNMGNVVHLYERDCSAQRRHQKIIEESPACHFSDDLRQKMTTAACQIAKEICYIGAGTIEFLVEKNEFYFMEMNTRLQVEHAVTEMITGIDLVEWQLRIASGESLPLKQEQISLTGHAIEIRVYAEDPEHGFLPSIGTIDYLRTPKESPTVRLETGIRENDSVSQYYDPMIAKLVIHAVNRETCLSHAISQLNHYHIAGVKTNIDFAKKVLQHGVFQAGEIDTQFITNFQADFKREAKQLKLAYACACLYRTLDYLRQDRNPKRDPHSPWGKADGWQLNRKPELTFEFLEHSDILAAENDALINKGNPSKKIIIRALHVESGLVLSYSDKSLRYIKGTLEKDCLHIESDQEHYHINIYDNGNQITLFGLQEIYQLKYLVPEEQYNQTNQATDLLLSPMPSTIVAISVTKGDKVKAGDKLMVVEAMKMEHTIIAPYDGIVSEIHFQIGQQANEGVELLTIDPSESSK